MNHFFPLLSSPILSTFPQKQKKSINYIYRYKYSYQLVEKKSILEQMLIPESFFSLDQFAHNTLWKKGDSVWAPLLHLKNYFQTIENFSIEIEIGQGVYLENREQISIGVGTIIEPGVFIQGPCIIGKNCYISHGAYIRSFVICGNECQLGHCAEVKHSILLNRAKATHFVYVGDSILGNEVNLGAGVKCANLRLDKREVKISVDGKPVATGLKKFGSIVGDRVQIGCNSVLSPGTLIAPDCVCHPLMHLHGFVPRGAEISPKGTQILEKLLCQSNLIASE